MNFPGPKKWLVGGLLTLFVLTALIWSLYGAILFPDPWKLTSLDLDIVLKPENGSMAVEGSADLYLEEGTSRQLVLVLPRGEMAFESLIVPETSAGTIAASGSRAVMRFPEPMVAGETVSVGFSFRNLASRMDRMQLPLGAFTVNESIAYVLSGVVAWHPLPAGGSGLVPGSTRLTVPVDWRTIANGELLHVQVGEDIRSETWSTDQAIERSFAAAAFHVANRQVGEARLGVYFPVTYAERAEQHLEALAQIVEILEGHFGPAPFLNYSIVAVEGYGYGAESQQDFLVAGSSLLFATQEQVNIALIGHETAHGWWGDHVRRSDPGGRMVTEGIAEYAAVLVVEALRGPEAATDFLRFGLPGYALHQSAADYFQITIHENDRPLMEADHHLANTKGPWFYHMLRRRVGDELFFDVLRGIVARHGGGDPISMEDIRDAFLGAAPPEARLEAFMDQWLEREGAPVLEVDWAAADGRSGPQVEVQIAQSGAPYELILEIAVDGTNGTNPHLVELTENEQTFWLASPGSPQDVRIDPQHRLLIWHEDAGYGPQP